MRVLFVARVLTGDYAVTQEIARILDDAQITDPDLRRDTLARYLKEALRIKPQQSRLLAERLQTRRPEIGAISLTMETNWLIGFGRVLEQQGTLSGVEELLATEDENQPETSA